jgi:CheY-like chemotaxis protein
MPSIDSSVDFDRQTSDVMAERRVLVVDDDRDMVETLADILQLHGWVPIKAYDGAEAITLCESQLVDAVVMDVRMPRVTGPEALRAIKARRPGLPVILITAIAADEVLARALGDGALRIFEKPVDLPALIRLLDGTVEIGSH